MSSTNESDTAGYACKVLLTVEECIFLASLITTYNKKTNSFTLQSCADYLLEYSDRRKADRRKK